MDTDIGDNGIYIYNDNTKTYDWKIYDWKMMVDDVGWWFCWRFIIMQELGIWILDNQGLQLTAKRWSHGQLPGFEDAEIVWFLASSNPYFGWAKWSQTSWRTPNFSWSTSKFYLICLNQIPELPHFQMMFHQFSIKNCGVPIKSSIYPYMHVFSMNFDFACPIFSWCFHMFIKKMVLDHLPFSIHVPMFILFTNENWWISQREIQARFASLRRQLAAAWFTTQGGLSQGLAHHRYSMGKTTIFRWNIWEKGWKMHGTWKISWEIPLCLIGKEIWKNGCKVKCRWKMPGIW